MANRFLLIDDDSDDRELFSEALAAVDPISVCDRAPDGPEALGKLANQAQQKPDMIFLDINLPVMSGWQILKQLKRTEDYRQIPVIMYSTSSNPRDKDIAKDLGALCFFTKPSSYQTLKGMLEIVVANMNQNQVARICEAVKQYLKAG